MTDLNTFLRRADALAKAEQISIKTLSLRIFNDGKKIDVLKAGGRIWPDTLDAAAKKLTKLERKVGA
jgi:hypothetical protein